MRHMTRLLCTFASVFVLLAHALPADAATKKKKTEAKGATTGATKSGNCIRIGSTSWRADRNPDAKRC